MDAISYYLQQKKSSWDIVYQTNIDAVTTNELWIHNKLYPTQAKIQRVTKAIFVKFSSTKDLDFQTNVEISEKKLQVLRNKTKYFIIIY